MLDVNSQLQGTNSNRRVLDDSMISGDNADADTRIIDESINVGLEFIGKIKENVGDEITLKMEIDDTNESHDNANGYHQIHVNNLSTIKIENSSDDMHYNEKTENGFRLQDNSIPASVVEKSGTHSANSDNQLQIEPTNARIESDSH